MSILKLLKSTALAAFPLLLTAQAWSAGNFPQPTICERSCWGARNPTGSISQMSGLDRAVIHHSASSTDYNTTGLEDSKAQVRAHQNYHMDVNGWSDIGYHFLTDKFGNKFEGREGSVTSLPRGAHDGTNSNSMGFNAMGYFHDPVNHQPTVEQRAALYDLIAWKIPDPFDGFGSSAYGSLSNVGYVAGHRNVKATACPGDLLYSAIGSDFFGGEARTEINARITGTSTGTTYIVDNDDGSPAYTETGTWATSGSSGYNGLTYRYATAGGDHTATWAASIAEAGDYQLYTIYRAGTNRPTAAKYDIFTAAGTQTVYIDQQLNNLTWVSLGTFALNSGSNTITLDALGSTPSGSAIISDAVKWVQVSSTGPTPTPGTETHVSAIVTNTVNLGGGKKAAQATVTIVDNQGVAVADATVNGTFSGSYNESGSALTDASGNATITTSSSVKGSASFTFCVDGVTHATLTYNATQNTVTCASQ